MDNARSVYLMAKRAGRCRSRQYPATAGQPARRAGQPQLQQYCFAGRRHDRLAQRRCRPDRRLELSDADPVPDRERPDPDAGRYQRQRVGHRRYPKAGQTAEFTVDAFPGREFEADVGQVRQAPITVQNVVTYDVVVEVANPEMLLKPGMTANVTIVTAERDDVLARTGAGASLLSRATLAPMAHDAAARAVIGRRTRRESGSSGRCAQAGHDHERTRRR